MINEVLEKCSARVLVISQGLVIASPFLFKREILKFDFFSESLCKCLHMVEQDSGLSISDTNSIQLRFFPPERISLHFTPCRTTSLQTPSSNEFIQLFTPMHHSSGQFGSHSSRSVVFCDVCRVDVDSCLLYTSPSPRDRTRSRMPSSA